MLMSQETSPQLFRPDRTHLLSAGIMICILLIGVSYNPLMLGWVLVFPIVFIVWVLKVKTVLNEDGISAHYLFGKPKSATWDTIAGISFKGSKALVERKDGTSFSLPGVSFSSLPKLEEASRGRIPDALTAGRRAADEKVVVVHKDGRQVLMTQEEYEQYQARAAKPGQTPSAKE